MTDWELTARALGIPAKGERLRSHIAVLEHLETVLAAWKSRLPLEMEPAPMFAPVLTRSEEAHEID